MQATPTHAEPLLSFDWPAKDDWFPLSRLSFLFLPFLARVFI